MNILRNSALINIFFCFFSSTCCTRALAHDERSSLVEHCKNGGFLLVNNDGDQNCFCHGTGFYGTDCNIPCPPSYPTECIQI